MRDLPITEIDILLTHSCHWEDTYTMVTEVCTGFHGGLFLKPPTIRQLMTPAKLVPEAWIYNVIINRSKGISDSETTIILELGGELFLFEEDLLGCSSAFDQPKLVMKNGGPSAEVQLQPLDNPQTEVAVY